MIRHPPTSTLCPDTTLFRSHWFSFQRKLVLRVRRLSLAFIPWTASSCGEFNPLGAARGSLLAGPVVDQGCSTPIPFCLARDKGNVRCESRALADRKSTRL